MALQDKTNRAKAEKEVIDKLSDEVLEKLDFDIDSLRIKFEQYFMGTLKRMPENERTALQYRIRRMSNIQTSNFALKYQFQQLVAKFNAYNQYWNRIIQKIETGQISREKLKQYIATGPIEDKEKKPVEKTETKPAPKEDLSSDKLDQVYRQLEEAKRAQNQPMTMSREKLEQTLKKQVEQIKEKYKDKKLEFDVVVESGQAKLRAKAKK
jgi:hypothetical protein